MQLYALQAALSQRLEVPNSAWTCKNWPTARSGLQPLDPALCSFRQHGPASSHYARESLHAWHRPKAIRCLEGPTF
eukprot:7334111-Alexandrium_andersonii.AAC.1